MNAISKPAAFYADFDGLAQLKGAAQNQDPKAIREAARQFESLFTQMMLKSMRQANESLPGGDSMMDNDQSDMYREMFDNQLALQLSKGRGLGLAEMLVRQITQSGMADTAAAAPFKMPNVVSPGEASLDKSSTKSHSPTTNAVMGTMPAALRKYMDEMWPVASKGTGGGRTAEQDVTHITPISSVDLPRSRALVTGDVQAQLINQSKVASTSKISAVQSSDSQPLATSATEFVKKMWPHAQAAARELGVDPKTLIAHAALETGWGKYIPCNPDGSCSFNLFGIKTGSRWQGSSVAVNTLEYQDGVAVKQRANFRAYDSPADSFRDYAAFIKNSPRYVAAIGAGDDAAKFANALQQGGYATDPNYATKLTATTMGVIARAAPWLKNITDQPILAGSSVSGAVSRGEKT